MLGADRSQRTQFQFEFFQCFNWSRRPAAIAGRTTIESAEETAGERWRSARERHRGIGREYISDFVRVHEHKKRNIKGHEWNALSVYLDFAVISSAELSFG